MQIALNSRTPPLVTPAAREHMPKVQREKDGNADVTCEKGRGIPVTVEEDCALQLANRPMS